MSPDRVSTLIDSVFVTRVLAARAREAGLDRDPAVQRRMQQLQEAFLADLYRQKVDKESDVGSLDKRARELYEADRSAYVMPEQVYVQQVLINMNGRTKEMAREKAQKVYEEVKSGQEEFLSYAARYSDEEQRGGSLRGDVGWGSYDKFLPPVRDALMKMKKGDISPPIETQFGFHVIKVVERKPAQTVKFEDVKDKIISAERERLKKERFDELLTKIRSSPTAIVHKENVDALVIPVDLEKVKRANEAASK